MPVYMEIICLVTTFQCFLNNLNNVQFKEKYQDLSLFHEHPDSLNINLLISYRDVIVLDFIYRQ